MVFSMNFFFILFNGFSGYVQGHYLDHLGYLVSSQPATFFGDRCRVSPLQLLQLFLSFGDGLQVLGSAHNELQKCASECSRVVPLVFINEVDAAVKGNEAVDD